MKESVRVYKIWVAMRQRCRNPNNPSYKDYGGRGIKICERWNAFAAFKADMGPRPAKHSIDRIDNDGDYTPSNCRWASLDQQAQNTRRTKIFEANGMRLSIRAWARKLGLMPSAVRRRLQIWPIERALSEPPNRRNQKNRARP